MNSDVDSDGLRCELRWTQMDSDGLKCELKCELRCGLRCGIVLIECHCCDWKITLGKLDFVSNIISC